MEKVFIACPSRFLRAVVRGDVTHLQQPKVPVFVYQQVKAKKLKAVGQREEAELAAHCLQALTCAATTCQEIIACYTSMSAQKGVCNPLRCLSPGTSDASAAKIHLIDSTLTFETLPMPTFCMR